MTVDEANKLVLDVLTEALEELSRRGDFTIEFTAEQGDEITIEIDPAHDAVIATIKWELG